MAITMVHWLARAGASAADATTFAWSSEIDGPYGGSFGPAAGFASVCVLTELLLVEADIGGLASKASIHLVSHDEVVMIEPEPATRIHHFVRRGGERRRAAELPRHFEDEQHV